MSFLAVLVLAAFSIRNIAVTLLPDIDIPTISIYASYPDHSASEIEQSVLAPLRQNIQQVGGLETLESKAADEQGILTARFPYGKDIDLAFVEVNEKLDLAINSLPEDLKRPVVIKTKASDIPTLYLSVRYRDILDASGDKVTLSEFSSRTVRRRLEQLPSVSMADITGTVSSHIEMIPDEKRMQSLGITHQNLQQAIADANISLGNIRVRERDYEYLIRVGRPINSLDDLKNTPLKIKGRVFYLRELADIHFAESEPEGIFTTDGAPGINMAIFKDFNARMSTFQEEVGDVITELESTHTDLVFHTNRDQAQLLNLSISGMRTALWLGCLLATVIVFFFYRDRRIPVIIGIVTPLSLAISVLFLYLFGLSINIISLSGIIMGIGMMIDNGIIILDNITQEARSGQTMEEACIRGTNEMAMPLLSSMLTTCAVFLPLIFLSDLAGALFYDQALSVSICLLVSYIVAIIFIPVLFFRMFRDKPMKIQTEDSRPNGIRRAYDKGFHFTFERSVLFSITVVIVLGGGVLAYQNLKKEKMPALPRTSMQLSVLWNTPLSTQNMDDRIEKLHKALSSQVVDFQAYIGPQQFVLNNHYQLDGESSNIFLSFTSPGELPQIKSRINLFFRENYPEAVVEINPDRDIFEIIFPSTSEETVLAYYHNQNREEKALEQHYDLKEEWAGTFGIDIRSDPPTREVVVLRSRDRQLLRYDMNKNYLLEVISQNINKVQLSELGQMDRDVPIVLTKNQTGLSELFGNIRVQNNEGQTFTIDHFFNTSTRQRMKYIYADQRGPYIPEKIVQANLEKLDEAITARKKEFPTENFSIRSSVMENRAMVREISLALLVAILLLYLIIAAQFESLVTPFIVIMEIPVSIAGALLALWLTGSTINAMSMIGMVVTIGIIINDSIIKIDTINRLHLSGIPLKEATHIGGQKRLYPILMTSLTTILAMTPYLIGDSFGTVLQKPLAISLIGSMIVGTLVSLFFIPKLYYWMKYSSQKLEK